MYASTRRQRFYQLLDGLFADRHRSFLPVPQYWEHNRRPAREWIDDYRSNKSRNSITASLRNHGSISCRLTGPL